MAYTLITFDCFASTQASGDSLVRARKLNYLRVGSRTTIMQSDMHTMEQMHKAVTRRVGSHKVAIFKGNQSISISKELIFTNKVLCY